MDNRKRKVVERYWLNKLSGNLPTAGLPRICITDGSPENDWQIFELEIPDYLTDSMLRMSNGSDIAMFILFLCGLKILLNKYTGKEDLIIGTLSPHRDGCNDEIIFCRSHMSDRQSIREIIQDTKGTVLESFNYTEYSFDGLYDKLCARRKEDLSGIFNMAFIYEKLQSRSTLLDRFALVMVLSESKGKMVLQARYQTSAYSSVVVQRFCQNAVALMESFPSKMDLMIEQMDSLSSAEKKELSKLNHLRAEYPQDKTIHHLFEDQVEQTPDNIAVSCEGKAITYMQLNDRANQLAHILRSKGVRPGDIVGVLIDRSIDMFVGILGILKAGGGYLPIDPEIPQERIISILEDACVSLIITNERTIRLHSFVALQGLASMINRILVTEARPPIEDLDKLPFPDRTLVDYEKYNRYIAQAMVRDSLSIQGTRGCPYQCAYCHKIWSKKHVVRSAENIFEEVLTYYKLGVQRFSFIDDIFNLDTKNSERFFKLLINNRLDVQLFFPNGLRGDLLSISMIDLMVEAGTVNIALALETASPRLQKLIGKHLDLVKFKENISYICEMHPQIISELFTMHGFPSETEDEAQMTLDYIKSLKWIHFPYLHILKIFPHTDMAQLASKHGISSKAIEASEGLAYHELPDTLPFPKQFTRKYQTEFLEEYFFSRERLRYVLPYQMKIFSEDEFMQKYKSYMPMDTNNFLALLALWGLGKGDLSGEWFRKAEHTPMKGFRQKISGKNHPEPDPDALKVLLLDLSQSFSHETHRLNDLVEPPLGLMYLMTYLQRHLGTRIKGTIYKSLVDFDDYASLKVLLDSFRPDVIGIRTLTYYKDFFHKTVALMRQWGIKNPIIVGGPYATSDYETLLQDRNVNVAVLGEGEITFTELIDAIINNKGNFPGEHALEKIAGIAFVPFESKNTAREIMMIDSYSHTALTGAKGNPEHLNQASDIAYVIYTSGSTGKPKGVIIEHRNVVSLLRNNKFQFDFDASDVWSMFHSYCFDFSVWEMYGALLYGGKLVVIPRIVARDPQRFLELLRQEQVTVLNQTPSSFYQLEKEELLRSDHGLYLRYIIFGGEALRPARLKAWKDRYPGTRLINMYGITETTVHVTYKEITAWDIARSISNIGRAISTLTTYIVDRNLNLVPMGVPGELCVGGAGVGRGYLNRQELTKERFIDNPYNPGERIYRSGDLVRLLENGEMEYLGRVDHQVKIRGFRIELGEIEAQLRLHAKIQEAVVMERTDEAGEAYLCAYIICQENITFSELRGFLVRTLPDYMIPTVFFSVGKIPLTLTGKVDKDALMAIGVRIKDIDAPELPRNTVEEKLLEIWQAILKVDRISTTMKFFDLGGTSFQALTLLAKLRQEFNKKDLYLSHIYDNTLAGLAEYILQDHKGEMNTIIGFGSIPRSREISLLCVPYAGGSASVYSPLAKAIMATSGNMAVYALALPGYDASVVDSTLTSVDDVARTCVAEICRKIDTPLMLYGHCAGSALTMEIARQYEEKGGYITYICLGAALPLPRQVQDDFVNDPWGSFNDEELYQILTGLGAFPEDLSPEARPLIMHSFRMDTKYATEYYLNRNTCSIQQKVKAPIYCIFGETDPLTRNYREDYLSWKDYSEMVTVQVLDGSGHYFIHDNTQELSKILLDLSSSHLSHRAYIDSSNLKTQ